MKIRVSIIPISVLVFIVSAIPSLGKYIPVYTGQNTSVSASFGDISLQSGKTSINGNSAAIKSGETTMITDVQDNRLFITYLGTEQNPENMVNSLSEFSLPNIQNDWTFEKVEKSQVSESESITYTFSSKNGNIMLKVSFIAREKENGPFEIITTIENRNTFDVKIKPESFASFNFDTNNGSWNITMIKKESGMSEGYTHYNGQSFEGKGIYTSKINIFTRKNAWVNTNQSFNENGWLPMIFMGNGSKGVYTALEWSSGRVNTKGTINGATVSVDMDKVDKNKTKFSTNVKAGDTFVFPTVYLGAYDGDIDECSNHFKKWFFEYKVPNILRDNQNEPLTQMDFQSGLETYGVEAVKWDYGWWTNDISGDWKTLEGSWKLRNTDYINALNSLGCSSISDFTKKAEEKGISLTTYLLLHDTIDESLKVSDQYGEFNSITHPDWFSDRTVGNGMGRSADLGNEECVEFLKEELADFFTDNGVRTWRTDFEPICYYSNLENRHFSNGSDVQYWCTTGFGEIIDYLYENVKNFRYESCSSGGSMKDLYTATKAVVINCDDCANYSGMRAAFYDSSYIIHPAQLQMPCNADFGNPDCEIFFPKTTQGNMEYGKFKDVMLDMQYRTQILGTPMFSSWTCNLETEYYREYSEMYKRKVRPLVRNGELWHILSRPDGVNWDGIMYSDADSENKIKGAVFLFKPSSKADDTVLVKMRGLDGNVSYYLNFEDNPQNNIVKTGKELMEKGIEVGINTSVGSEIIWIESAD